MGFEMCFWNPAAFPLIRLKVRAPEQLEGCLSGGSVMPDSSRRSQRQHWSGKTVLQENQEQNGVSQPPEQETEVDLAMQAEVEACMAQYQQERPEEFARAWAAGVYNPLVQVDLVAVGV